MTTTQITPNTRVLGTLRSGTRFTVTQFPEGTLTGRVEFVEGPVYADDLIDVTIDGVLSCWPASTLVEELS